MLSGRRSYSHRKKGFGIPQPQGIWTCLDLEVSEEDKDPDETGKDLRILVKLYMYRVPQKFGPMGLYKGDQRFEWTLLMGLHIDMEVII